METSPIGIPNLLADPHRPRPYMRSLGQDCAINIASELRGNSLKRFKDSYLRTKARMALTFFCVALTVLFVPSSLKLLADR